MNFVGIAGRRPQMSNHVEHDDATDTRHSRGREGGFKNYKSKWMILSLVVLAQGVSSFESLSLSVSPSSSWPRRESPCRLSQQNAGKSIDTTTTSLALVDRKLGGRECSPWRSRTSMRMVKGTSAKNNMADSSQRMMELKNLDQDIVKLGRSGKTNQALELYFSIAQPTVRLMNSAIDACSRARPTRLSQAFDILDDGVRTKQLQPNVFTFGAIMSACSRDRNADRALQVLHSMEEKYNVSPNAVVYSSAISACARCQPPRPDQALELLRVAVEEKELSMSVVGFNAALSSCAQAGDWERAIYLLERMKAAAPKTSTALEARIPAPDAVTYGTVLAACERGEKWSLILKYAKSMTEQFGLEFLDGLSLTSCLHACQQLGLAEEALYYLDAMKRLECPERKTSGWKRQGVRQPLQGPDPVAYHLAISACARGGAWEDGLRLLNEHEQVTGVAPDVVAYTSAITGCEYAGEWKQAFMLLDKMRQNGVGANEMTMTAVIAACATALAKRNRVRNGEESEKVVDGKIAEAMPEEQIRALQLLTVLKKDPNTVKPNIQIYNAAIRVCAEAFDLDRAMKLLEQIQLEGLQRTVVTYGSLMTACERVGCVDSVSKVFRSMKADNITRNEKVYGAAISCCRKAKEPERALLLLRKMIQEGLTPNSATFNTVMMAQTEGRAKIDMERAVLVFKLMKSKNASEESRPNRQTYSMLVRLFATSMQPNTAERFLRKMRDDGFVPDVDLFTATVTGYERTGQPLKALRLMESMQADGYDFYGVKVLNTAFKKAVQLANIVGRNLASPDDDEKEDPSFQLDNIDEDGAAFLQVNR